MVVPRPDVHPLVIRFVVQWGLGLLIDALQAAGLEEPAAFRLAVALYGVACLFSYLWFLWKRLSTVDNVTSPYVPS